MFLHPFDHPALLAGYGSLAVEILRDVPDVDVIVVGCGGGALFASLSAYFHLYSNDLDMGGLSLNDEDTPTTRSRRRTKKGPVRVFGVEPETANVMDLSLKVKLCPL